MKTTTLTYFQFHCQICEQLILEKDAGVMIKNKVEENNLLFGKIITLQVGHKIDNENHWNVIVLDHNGEYRGHKHAFTEDLVDTKESSDPSLYNYGLLQDYAKKKLSILIQEVILEHKIMIITQDKVLGEILTNTLKSFSLTDDTNKFENSAHLIRYDSPSMMDVSSNCTKFLVENKKVISNRKIHIFKWIEKVLSRIKNLDEISKRQTIRAYVGSLKTAYNQMIKFLAPYFTKSEVCIVTNPNQTINIQVLIDNLIPKKEIKYLQEIYPQDEYDIIIALVKKKFLN